MRDTRGIIDAINGDILNAPTKKIKPISKFRQSFRVSIRTSWILEILMRTLLNGMLRQRI
ncbi:MAG: hypothetical protein ACLVKR_00660 [Lachnospiraceae bacterium]